MGRAAISRHAAALAHFAHMHSNGEHLPTATTATQNTPTPFAVARQKSASGRVEGQRRGHEPSRRASAIQLLDLLATPLDPLVLAQARREDERENLARLDDKPRLYERCQPSPHDGLESERAEFHAIDEVD